MDATNGQFLDEAQHLRQSIRDILTTPIGTRLARRDYGSRIPEFLDRPINHALLLQLASAAVMALKQYEPRIQVEQLRPFWRDNVLTLSMRYQHQQRRAEIDQLAIFTAPKTPGKMTAPKDKK